MTSEILTRQSYLIASPTAMGTFSFRVPLKHIFGFCEDYDNRLRSKAYVNTGS